MEPAMPQKAPYVKEEPAGDTWWCACGHSKNQPYCDGSHSSAAPGISPVKVTLPEPKKVAWCGCKRSKNPPYCDGAHKRV